MSSGLIFLLHLNTKTVVYKFYFQYSKMDEFKMLEREALINKRGTKQF